MPEPTAEPPPTVIAASATFDELYRTHYPGMARLAFLLVGSTEAAEDITQDAFVGLHRHLHRVSDPVAYVRRSVANGARSHHRRVLRGRHRPVERERIAELGASELFDALATLNHRQRTAVVLRFHHDLADRQIAEILGVKEATVASLIHRALAHLRTQLGEHSSSTTDRND